MNSDSLKDSEFILKDKNFLKIRATQGVDRLANVQVPCDLDLKWYLAGYRDKALPQDVPPSVLRERCSDAISRFPDNYSSN